MAETLLATTKVLVRGDLLSAVARSSPTFQRLHVGQSLAFTAEVQGGPREPVHAIVWAYQSWRCEYHAQPEGAKRVTLVHEGKMLLDYLARDAEEARDIASFWRELVGTEDGVDSEPVDERRRSTDRRQQQRRGRRRDDADG